MGWCFERIDGCCLKWGDTCTFGIEEKRRVLFVIEEKRRIVSVIQSISNNFLLIFIFLL